MNNWVSRFQKTVVQDINWYSEGPEIIGEKTFFLWCSYEMSLAPFGLLLECFSTFISPSFLLFPKEEIVGDQQGENKCLNHLFLYSSNVSKTTDVSKTQAREVLYGCRYTCTVQLNEAPIWLKWSKLDSLGRGRKENTDKGMKRETKKNMNKGKKKQS